MLKEPELACWAVPRVSETPGELLQDQLRSELALRMLAVVGGWSRRIDDDGA